MKIRPFILIILSLLMIVAYMSRRVVAQDEANTCMDCHLELDGELSEPALKFSGDVHNIEGLSCAGCHGGDPAAEDAELAMSEARGFRGTPSALDIPRFCGTCHSDPAFIRNYNPTLATDQLDKYWTSHHGQLNKRGDRKAAECVSCHGVHDIRGAGDPRSSVYAKNVPQTCANCHADKEYMASYKIPHDQYEKYRTSIHGEALLLRNDAGAPACNDCHGNHAAMPPGVSSIGRVCFQCHPAEGELFIASPHKRAFDEVGEAECSFCHGNHAINILSDEDIGVDDGSICIQCHGEGDAGYQAAAAIKAAMLRLSQDYQEAKTLIDDAEKKGVEVSDEQFKLDEVGHSLINVRKLIHAFNPDTINTQVKEVMIAAEEVRRAGVQAIAEVKNRRSGFLVFTLVSVLLVLVILVKIRRMEKR